MRPPAAAILALALGAGTAAAERSAGADVTHVVQPGHTIEAIAHRYRVSVQAICEANHLDPKRSAHLKPGETLIIPGVEATPPAGAEGKVARSSLHGVAVGRGGRAAEHHQHWERGVVQTLRVVSSSASSAGAKAPEIESVRIRVRDTRGHIPSEAIKAFERVMSEGGAMILPDPRLVALVGIVSDHFEGRPLEIVSGYRPYTPTQYTPHSNHNFGRALDFRVQGIRNETLRDFCRTLRNAGCGYYPNSTFVHLDVRDAKAYWVDRSRPGEPPLYDTPGAAADEGTSDVPSETSPTEAEPSDSPNAPLEPPAVRSPEPQARALPPLPPPP